MKHLPNSLTIFRIIATPVLIFLLLGETTTGHFWALFLFVAASITDYLDGKLARSLEVRSRLGQFLDPLADKILVLGTFFTLYVIRPDLVPLWAAIVIALRDLALTALRSWAESQGRSIATLPLAKTKTTVQLTFLIAILVFLFVERLSGPLARLSHWILESQIPFIAILIVVFMTVLTGVLYFLNIQKVAESD